MVIALVLLFVMASSLSFIEDRISERDKRILYVILGIAMVLIAGLREVGSTPDSEDYELMFYGKTNKVLEAATEPSFAIISSFRYKPSFDSLLAVSARIKYLSCLSA